MMSSSNVWDTLSGFIRNCYRSSTVFAPYSAALENPWASLAEKKFDGIPTDNSLRF